MRQRVATGFERDLDLPLSPDAERIYKGSPSLLRRYLPFWMVVCIQRFIVVGIPLLIIAIPVVRFIPVLWRWRIRRGGADRRGEGVR